MIKDWDLLSGDVLFALLTHAWTYPLRRDAEPEPSDLPPGTPKAIVTPQSYVSRTPAPIDSRDAAHMRHAGNLTLKRSTRTRLRRCYLQPRVAWTSLKEFYSFYQDPPALGECGWFARTRSPRPQVTNGRTTADGDILNEHFNYEDLFNVTMGQVFGNVAMTLLEDSSSRTPYSSLPVHFYRIDPFQIRFAFKRQRLPPPEYASTYDFIVVLCMEPLYVDSSQLYLSEPSSLPGFFVPALSSLLRSSPYSYALFSSPVVSQTRMGVCRIQIF
ncbi:hypothetical protein B0H16DRAFT_1469376 [Mycena metata]|uniref:Uncharacterized protein n=1 Tax=Mycena metata TaxID=1033252 RepID=A0AAD7HYB7_9AGAR|nr:hypothetical protein B0H16DRAFT_1469376 [Mycena metata]